MSIEWVIATLVAAIGAMWGVMLWLLQGWIADLRKGKEQSDKAYNEIAPALRSLTDAINREGIRREMEQRR